MLKRTSIQTLQFYYDNNILFCLSRFLFALSSSYFRKWLDIFWFDYYRIVSQTTVSYPAINYINVFFPLELCNGQLPLKIFGSLQTMAVGKSPDFLICNIYGGI